MHDLTRRWNRRGHQTCHAFGYGAHDDDDDTNDEDFKKLIGEDVWCQGFYESQIPNGQRRIIEYLAAFGIVAFIEQPETTGEKPAKRTKMIRTTSEKSTGS